MAAIDASAGDERAERQGWSLSLRLPTLLFLLFIAAAIWFVAFVAQYEPLTLGSMGGLTAPGEKIDTFGEPGTIVQLDHREGEEFFVMFTMRNEGPIGVTIEHLLRPRRTGTFYPVEVLVHPGERFAGERSIDYEKWDPFEPFSLGSGEDRRVAIRYRFGSCTLGRGEATGSHSLFPRFSVFGIDRHTEFQLPYALMMESALGGGCP